MRLRRNFVVVIALASLLNGVATAQDQTPTTPIEGSKYDNLIKVRTSGGVVVSESMQASQAGIDALNAGGNAVDAAIATTFANRASGYVIMKMSGFSLASEPGTRGGGRQSLPGS